MTDYTSNLIGKRVSVHPATDAWMMGDKYGEVVKITAKYWTLKMDSGRTRRFTRDNIADLID